MIKERHDGLKRELRLIDSVALIVCSVIGSGIFLVPSAVAQNIQEPGMTLLIWIFTGAIALFGGLSYAELGSIMPFTGGQYVYIKESYGNFLSFLYGWTLFWIINSGSIATLAVAFSMYYKYLFPVEIVTQKLIAVGCVAILTAINYRGIRFNAMIQNVFAFVKVGSLLLIIIFGFSVAKGNLNNMHPLFPSEFSLKYLSVIGIAMVGTLWTYEGWHLLNFVSGEIKNPKKNIPISLVTGILILISIYLMANILYFYYMPISEIANSDFLAAETTERFAGAIGGIFITAVILISVFGAAHSNLVAGPRVFFAMAKDKLFFSKLATVHPKFKSPHISVVIQGLWSAVLTLIIGTYSGLFTFVISAAAIFYALTVGSIFILRKKYPDIERPYKVWGYPVVPIIFILVITAFVINSLVNTFITEPKNALLFVFIIVFGIPAYYYWSSKLKNEQEISNKS
ncbi:APC family permease [candidate division KSB1 bacterium]